MSALQSWFDCITPGVRNGATDLTARQMAILLSVYLKPGPHTVRGLAGALNISKPAVSRALDRLGILEYARRERDVKDARNVLVAATEAGAVFLEDFGRLVERIIDR